MKKPVYIPFILNILLLNLNFDTFAQKQEPPKWNLHFQQTIITQYKPSFKALYSGQNSLKTEEETQTSLTSTLFFGLRLNKNTEFYFNPEIAGGSGLSRAVGIAGFTNGETFRVGSPEPKIYMARAYIKHFIPLSKDTEEFAEGKNQVAGSKPSSYLFITAGKFCLADFFDNNKYSHDPRTQFMNWSLMSNGAWDYAADVRGYTLGFVIELAKPTWAVRFSSSLVPDEANGRNLDFDIANASAETVEFEKKYTSGGQSGILRLLAFHKRANMGNFNQAINESIIQNREANVISTREIGRKKVGIGINWEHTFNKNVGFFAKASWNDGSNETWAFTQIDHSISAGAVLNGNLWKRINDHAGLAFVTNGISNAHRTYLSLGGRGFMIGDGKINYTPEIISELYYSFQIKGNMIWISPNYQFVVNPAYNRDRGPVHVFSLRAHIAL